MHNIVARRDGLATLEWRASGQQTALGGSGRKDTTTGKLAFGVDPSAKDAAAGRPPIPNDLSLLSSELRTLVAFQEDTENARRFWQARRVGMLGR